MSKFKFSRKEKESLFEFGLLPCVTCGEALPVGSFDRDSRKRFGVRPTCKACYKRKRSNPMRLIQLRLNTGYNKAKNRGGTV